MKILYFLFLSLFVNFCSREKDVPSDFRIEKEIKVGSLNRTFILVLPSNYYDSNTKFPLVIAMHGGGGSAKQMEESYELPQKAESEKYIMVYPDGVQSDGILKARTWNAGICCEYAMEQNIDDVGFLSKMIDEIVENYRVNSKQVFATGMSNGGMMAYRLACELSGKIAAIAPVACTLATIGDCKPNKAIPIIHFHSELDKHVPFGGGVGIRGINYPAVEKGLNTWANLNFCKTKAKVEVDNEKYKKTSWSDCNSNAEINFYLTKDGGHSWPGISKVRIGGDDPSTALNANDLIFDFFKKHSLP
jgi:polyhydroxybutyrate depolymerase